MAEKDIVIPGEFLGTSEEYISGEGVYSEKGNIYASTVGKVDMDGKERKIRVIPETDTPPVPKTGDIVVGRVVALKGSMVIVEIAGIKGKEDREMPNCEQAVIHISNIRKGYVGELNHEFGYHDIVKARVLDARMLRLTTVDRDLGVIKAFCSRCRAELRLKNRRLECPRCENVETRKISQDYGKGII